MTKKGRITIIISMLVIALVVVFINAAIYNKPHTNVSESSPNVSLASNTLLEEFENDEIRANSKYLEQIIQVTGIISALNTANGNGIVTLSGESATGSVMCHLSPEENKKMSALKKGQNVVIKGICTGYLMDVILIKCVIVN